MKTKMILILIFVALIGSLLLCMTSTIAEATVSDVSIRLVSFNYEMGRALKSDHATVWLRFEIFLDDSNGVIEDFDVIASPIEGAKARWSDASSVSALEIPNPNPDNLFYGFTDMDISFKSDEELTALFREATYEFTMTIRDTVRNCIYTVTGQADTSLVTRDIFQEDGDYAIRINECAYLPIAADQIYPYGYGELADFLERHPDGTYYQVQFSGMAVKQSHHVVLGISFKSNSPNTFVKAVGMGEGTVTPDWDVVDMLENGEREIGIPGIVCVPEGSTLEEEISHLSLSAFYSPEYTGDLDIQMGSRMAGPRVEIQIDTSQIVLIPELQSRSLHPFSVGKTQ